MGGFDPDSLGDAGRTLWDGIQAARAVDRTTEALVVHVCGIADILARLSDDIQQSGLTVKIYDRTGEQINEVANPLLTEYRQQLLAFKNVMNSLGISELAPASSGKKSWIDELTEKREKRMAAAANGGG